MEIFINDNAVSCPKSCTLSELLRLQEIVPMNIAIAIDDSVIPKKQWETTKVIAGSHIVIIKAVQGG